jgi:hypothetical protein
VDAVCAEQDRRLDVIVHNEGRLELVEGLPGLDELVRGRALAPQLDERGAADDRGLRGLEVLDDRVEPHWTLARASRVTGSSAASSS